MSRDGYLPPGCSHRDVDIAAGALRMCPVCDTWTYDDTCPECGYEYENDTA